MQAAILSIGDELVLGQTVDTNSAWLSAELAGMGIGTLFHYTVADDRSMITKAIIEASQTVGLIIISGGLGPTEDDLTRDAMADAMGTELIYHEPSLQAIRARMERLGRTMPERNKVQALHPKGTTIIENRWGTAPGIKAVLRGATIYVTPGVPSEMKAMWQHLIRPEIESINPTRDTILTTTIRTFGLGESTVGERLGKLMDRNRNPKVGTTVSGGVVSVRIRSEFADPATARRELEDTAQQIEAVLGAFVYGRDDDELQDAVISLLTDRNITVATAESCTGGLVGRLLTDVAGSSRAYAGGWVTYSNQMKIEQLGVPAAMIQTQGAVSEDVARAMATGALERGHADYAISVTGIAGPDGGTEEKPVGTVWMSLAWRDGGSIRTDAMQLHLGNGRDIVRERSAKCALQMLRLHLLGADIDHMIWGHRVSGAK